MSPHPTCVDLAALYGDRYRVGFQGGKHPRRSLAGGDRPWHLEVRCRYGRVYPRSGDVLAAWTDHGRIGGRLRRLPFILSAQGAAETVVTFHLGDADAVLAILRPYRRRQVSAEQRERLRRIGAGTRFGAQRGTQRGLNGAGSTGRHGRREKDQPAAAQATDGSHRTHEKFMRRRAPVRQGGPGLAQKVTVFGGTICAPSPRLVRKAAR